MAKLSGKDYLEAIALGGIVVFGTPIIAGIIPDISLFAGAIKTLVVAGAVALLADVIIKKVIKSD